MAIKNASKAASYISAALICRVFGYVGNLQTKSYERIGEMCSERSALTEDVELMRSDQNLPSFEFVQKFGSVL